jgi:hypothetical protein
VTVNQASHSLLPTDLAQLSSSIVSLKKYINIHIEHTHTQHSPSLSVSECSKSLSDSLSLSVTHSNQRVVQSAIVFSVTLLLCVQTNCSPPDFFCFHTDFDTYTY